MEHIIINYDQYNELKKMYEFEDSLFIVIVSK